MAKTTAIAPTRDAATAHSHGGPRTRHWNILVQVFIKNRCRRPDRRAMRASRHARGGAYGLAALLFIVAAAVPAVACGDTKKPIHLRIYDPKGLTAVEITNVDIRRASVRASFQRGAATVSFRLTKKGVKEFRSLTRSLARRGARLGKRQRFALSLGNRVYARVLVDFRAFPNGLDARPGLQIDGVGKALALRFLTEMRRG
jgi:hypothetical protein